MKSGGEKIFFTKLAIYLTFLRYRHFLGQGIRVLMLQGYRFWQKQGGFLFKKAPGKKAMQKQ